MHVVPVSFNRILLFFLLLAGVTAHVRAGSGEGGHAAASFGNPPGMFFVENRGQFADMDGRARPDIRYVLFAGDMRVFVRSTGLSFVQTEQKRLVAHDDRRHGAPFRRNAEEERISIERTDMDFLGSNPFPHAQGEEALGWYANFYTAGAPDGVTNLVPCRRVKLVEVWKGIDLILRIEQGTLKYEFIVRPGGRYQDISIRYSDNAAPALRGGALEVRTGLGTLTEDAPRCWTEGGIGAGPVDGCFVLEGRHLRYAVRGAMPGTTLVIDPSISWSTYIGSSANDYAGAVEVDGSGDVVLTGSTKGTNFPTSTGSFQPAMSTASTDGFVIKFTSSGAMVWGTYYAGADVATGTRCDASDNIFFTGTTGYGSFPVSGGAFQPTKSAVYDAFIVKLLTGGQRSWATLYGGSDFDVAQGLAVDGSGGVYITGETGSANFPVTGGTQQGTFAGGYSDAFLVKFDAYGNRRFGTYYGGADDQYGHALAVDSAGNILMVGSTEAGFPATTGTISPTFPGGLASGFLAKFDSAGNRLWCTFFGSNTYGYDVSAFGNQPVISGWTEGSVPVTTGAFQNTRPGAEDAFIARINSSGSAVVWATYLGGTALDHITTAQVRGTRLYVVGCTYSSDFPNPQGATQQNYGGSEDRFVAIFNAAGNRCWSTFLGGTGTDLCWSTPTVGERPERSVAVTPSGDFYVSGCTTGAFPTSTGSFQYSSAGNDEAFLTRYASDCNGMVVANAGRDTSICRGNGVLIGLPAGGSPCSAPYTYSWSPATGLSGTTSAQVVASPTATTTYTVTVTDANNCVSTDDITVTITGFGATLTPANPLLCPWQSVTLQASTGTNYTYVWLRDGFVIAGANGATYNASQAGAYRAIITDGNGCYDTTNVSQVTMGAGPGATITPQGPTSFCQGGNVVLNANTGTGYTYQWFRNNVPTGAGTSTLVAGGAGTYKVIVTGANGCPDTSAGLVVTVFPGPGAALNAAGPVTFCSGGSVLLTANTGSGFTYEWRRNYIIISGATSSSYTATQAGSYRVFVTNTNGCSDSSNAIIVTINSGPGATATAAGPTTFCEGQSVLLSANTGTNLTYVWQRNLLTIAGATGADLTATSAGSYRVIVTNAGGCSDTSNAIVITLLPRPVAGLTAAGPVNFCLPGSVLLTASPATGVTYKWLSTGVPIGGATSSTYMATSSGRYRVIVTGSNGCFDTSAVVNVVASPRPGATITAAPTQICEGSSSLLSANVDTGLVYTWQRNFVTIAGASGATYHATQAGSYRVIVTSSRGCSDTSVSVPLSVFPKPGVTASAAGPKEFCEPGSVTLNANAAPGLALSWHLNGVAIAGATGTSYVATQTGSYSVVVRDANGCTDTSAAIAVTAHPRANAAVTPPGPLSYCEGTVTVLVATAGAGFVYEWQRNGTTINGANGPAYAVVAPGSYRAIITTGAGCRDTSAAVFITLNPLPAQRIEGKTSVCPNSLAAYFISNGAGYSFDWTVRNGALVDGQGTPTINARWGGAGTGEVRVRITNTTTGCARDTMLQVSITTTLRPVIVADGNGILCEGDSLGLDAGAGYASYAWQRDGAAYGGNTRSIAVTLPGVYTVSVTDAGGCAGTSGPVSVTVNAKPKLTLAAQGPVVLCTGEHVTLAASSTETVTYAWYRDGGEILGVSGNTYTTAQPGSYRVTALSQAGCPGASDSVLVTVRPTPDARASALGPTLLCEGDSVLLRAKPDTGVTYQWLRDGAAMPGTAGATLVAKQSGSYRVIAADAAAGCRDSSDAVIVTVRPIPQVRIDGPAVLCAGDNVTLTAAGTAGSLRWSTGETSPSITVAQGGVIQLTVTDSAGCTATASHTIAEHPALVIPKLGTRVICPGGRTTLDAKAGFASYAWSTGERTQRITVAAAGSYVVVITDSNGCSAHDTVVVIENSTLQPGISGTTALCAGAATTLEADSSESYARYIWSLASDTTTYLGTSRRFTVTAPGRYMLRVTDKGGCSGSVVVDVQERSGSARINGRMAVCNGRADTLDAGAGYVQYAWNTGATSRQLIVTQPGAYSVDVTDSNGCVWKASAQVLERTVTPVVAGMKTFCTGGAARLSAQWAGAVSYEWSTGERTRDVALRTAGPFWVKVTDSAGCEGIVFDTLRESTSLTPAVAGARSFCKGAGTRLDAGPGLQSCLWSGLDTTALLGSGRYFDVAVAGTYIVRIADSGGCKGIDTITVAEAPPLLARITGDSAFCAGGGVLLRATQGLASYEWSTGLRADTLLVSRPGVYWLRVTNGSGCADTLRVNVTEYPLPSPVIARQGDTLRSAVFTAYQWMRDGSDIAGATARQYLAATPGSYALRVTDANGCTGISPPVDVQGGMGTARVSLQCLAERERPAGSMVNVPLQLDGLASAPAGSATTFTAVISTNPRVAYPLFAFTAPDTAMGRTRMHVRGSRPASLLSGTLLELPFEVLWGDTPCTEVRVDSLRWDDGTITDLRGAVCEICATLCYEGGARLFRADGKVSLANRPNPFNASTIVEYEVIEYGETDLSIFDMLGRRVATLVHGTVAPGRYVLPFDAGSLPSGMYVCVLRTPSEHRTLIMEVLK